MNESTDIREPLYEILSRLGLDPLHVASLEIGPVSAKAIVFKVDEHGREYLNEDMETAAQETFVFKVST